jgi:hypothetical protein
MLFENTQVSAEEFARVTGWELKPEGACQGKQCVPLRGAWQPGEGVDVGVVAERLAMPVVTDRGRVALGPPAGGHALRDTQLPPLVLPDLDGAPFDLATLRGRRVLLLAWASW